MKTIIILEVHHSDKATDLIDKVAGRAYTIDGVSDVTARRLTAQSHGVIRLDDTPDMLTTIIRGELPALLKKQAS